MNKLVFICSVLGIVGCNTVKPYYNKEVANWEIDSIPRTSELTQTVYLIGDGGEPQEGKEPVMELLKTRLSTETQEKTAVIFLGDNIYYNGLPEEDHPDRIEAERRFKVQLDAVKDFSGKIFMIPGNHDWHRGKKDGLEYVLRQGEFAENYLQKGNIYLPDHGCPGPEEIALTDDITLLIMDSQWWLHKYKKPVGEDMGCSVENDVDFLFHVEDIINRNKDKKILAVAHHPIISRGSHGGKFSWKEHVFPLLPVNKKLYIPLPLIGSLHPLYRGILGNIQDIPHPRNKALMDGLTTAFSKQKGMVYAAGHEHSLQYVEHNGFHHIVSGSGSKSTYAKMGRQEFVHSHKGVSRLRYYKNGEVFMDFIIPNQSGGEIIFSKKLESESEESIVESIKEKKTYADSLVKVVPDEIFEASNFKKMVFGSQYRDVWLTPIEIPVLDINVVHGGLTPIKKGGGMATKSLRMMGGDGKQYVLRSIEKYPDKAIPKLLRKTVASDVVKDQISSAHPYAAFAVPSLADAVGVRHTNPQLVIIPDDPALGIYREEFAGMVVLFEERLSGDQKKLESFGKADDIISSFDVIENIAKSNKYKVNQKELVKARMFDILLGDWDRHEDQWRWAVKKKKGVDIYSPIPRDRDQVFYKVNGFLPSLFNRKWAIRKFQNFNHEIRDIAGLGFNSRFLDRSFLNEMDKNDWVKAAEEIKFSLTDEAIEKAFESLPESVQNLHKSDLISKLKSRRYNLPQFAAEFYLILAKEVDVVGTKEDELFKVERLENGSVRVRVYALTKKGKKDDKVYDRIFLIEETNEIRIYGLGGDDEFELEGEVDKSILVRIIGGKGKDKVTDASKVGGIGKKTKVYDTKGKKGEKTKLDLGTEGKDLTSKSKDVNDYDRREFKFNNLGPQAFFGYNADDGLFVGGGILYTSHGFRKDPFKQKHRLVGNFALNSGAFNFHYKGEYTDLVGKFDLVNELKVQAPEFQSSFYGLGNETKITNTDNKYYWLRINRIEYQPTFGGHIADDQILRFGLSYQYNKPEMENERFAGNAESNLTSFDFRETRYGGINITYELEKIDNKVLPTRGVKLYGFARVMNELNSQNSNFINLSSELTVYNPIKLPFDAILALRVGGSVIRGKYEFYQATNLSGLEHIRGFRRNRFTGSNTFYQNSEIRIKLFDFRTYVFPGQFGLLGFYDIGRVWIDNDQSDVMHWGTGGGFYLSPFDRVVLASYYSISDENRLLNVNFGFFF